MADSYELRDGEVIPFSGGRMHTDTTCWREATTLELEQQKEIQELNLEVDSLKQEIYELKYELKYER